MKKAWAISPTCIEDGYQMIINHPLLGPRDSAEFVYMGDANLIKRPDPDAETATSDFVEYAYMRDNPAGIHRELWFHEAGDRSWLVVTRNTLTHEISDVQMARDVARKMGRST
jgi:sarcosine oxidase subunit delta